MKGCWIGILGTGALVISAFGQNGVGPQALVTNTRLGTVSPDKRLQLPSTGRQILDDQTQNEMEQVSDVQISGKTLVVLPPDASHDVPTAIVEYLGLTPVQIAAIRAQITEPRGQVQSLMQQLTNNRWELIATTLKGQFDIRQVCILTAQQARILEPLVVANARLRPKSTRFHGRATAKA